MTPSGFSIGTNLNTKLSLSILASKVGPVRKSMIPVYDSLHDSRGVGFTWVYSPSHDDGFTVFQVRLEVGDSQYFTVIPSHRLT